MDPPYIPYQREATHVVAYLKREHPTTLVFCSPVASCCHMGVWQQLGVVNREGDTTFKPIIFEQKKYARDTSNQLHVFIQDKQQIESIHLWETIPGTSKSNIEIQSFFFTRNYLKFLHTCRDGIVQNCLNFSYIQEFSKYIKVRLIY